MLFSLDVKVDKDERFYSVPLSKPFVVLVGVESIDVNALSSVLVSLGYEVKCITSSEYRSDLFDCPPLLIIVDVKSQGYEAINNVKKIRGSCQADVVSYVSRVIAIVDVAEPDKELLYRRGADDYISSPLIALEIETRIMPANQRYELQNIFCKKQTDSSKKKSAAELHPMIEQSFLYSDEYLLAEKTGKYLKKHLSNEVSLNSLSREMGVNRNKLSQAFKAYYGVSLFVWLREQRMLFAAELLTTTTQTVQEIACLVGYNDSNNFSTAFKRTFQLAPLKYRIKEMKSAAGKQ